MTTEPRTSHPYHMHEAILAQPEAFVRVVERNGDAIEEFASRIASCRRVFLAGIGTSHHATLVGEHLMRAYGGGPDVRAFYERLGFVVRGRSPTDDAGRPYPLLHLERAAIS